MSTVLFIPRRVGFSAAQAAHAQVTRISYTVPTGKRAIATATIVLIEAAGTAFITVNIILYVGNVQTHLITNAGVAKVYSIVTPDIDLASGEVIRIDTVATSAVAQAYSGSIIAREYQ